MLRGFKCYEHGIRLAQRRLCAADNFRCNCYILINLPNK